MAISELPVSGPSPVPENPKQYVVTIDVIITAESELAAADRVADLGRRLTEDREILDPAVTAKHVTLDDRHVFGGRRVSRHRYRSIHALAWCVKSVLYS